MLYNIRYNHLEHNDNFNTNLNLLFVITLYHHSIVSIFRRLYIVYYLDWAYIITSYCIQLNGQLIVVPQVQRFDDLDSEQNPLLCSITSLLKKKLTFQDRQRTHAGVVHWAR